MTLREQVLELAAWEHELRNARGEWTHGDGEALRGRSRRAAQVPPAALHADGEEIRKTADRVPAMISAGDTLDWDHLDPSLTNSSDKSLMAQIDWYGHMQLAPEVASGLAEDAKGTGPVQHPVAFLVALHELIHATVPDGQARYANGDKQAYRELPGTKADIEEGFTQLGAVQHAAEYFKAMGVADRPIGGEDIANAPPGTTMRQLAEHMADPREIEDGQWGSYPDETAHAYTWLRSVAGPGASPEQIRQMADQINAVGTKAKLKVMAQLSGQSGNQVLTDWRNGVLPRAVTGFVS